MTTVALVQQRECGIGAVVQILIGRPLGLILAWDQTDRVDIEDQGCFATPVAGIGVEHP
jgi:hypothetical protein